MRVEVCVFRLDLFELLLCLVKRLPVRPLSQLLKDVSGAAVVEGVVCSPGAPIGSTAAGDLPSQHTPAGRGYSKTATRTNPCFATGPQPESG